MFGHNGFLAIESIQQQTDIGIFMRVVRHFHVLAMICGRKRKTLQASESFDFTHKGAGLEFCWFHVSDLRQESFDTYID